MASLADIRAQNPAYSGLDDAALADLLHREFYSDLPRDDFNRRIGLTANPDEIVQRGTILPYGITAAGKPVLALPEMVDAPRRVVTEILEGKRAIGDVSGQEVLDLGGLYVGSSVAAKAARRALTASRSVVDETPATAPAVVPPVPSRAAGAVDDAMTRLADEAAAADAVAAEPAASALAGQAIDQAARRAGDAERAATSGPSLAGNINLDRIYAPDDVKAAIIETAAQNREFIAARRGRITQDETREMAGLLGMSADDLASRKIGQAFNAEQMFAARQLLVAQAEKVRGLATRARGGSDADRADFAKELTRLVTIQEQVSGATAEAGRALAQFRMLASASRDDIARMVEASKASGIDDMARAIADMDSPAQVAAFSRNAYKATTSDMMYEAWINGLLSGPTTHAANIASNALVSLWGIAESATAAAISKVTGSGIAGREALGRAWGVVEGAAEGIKAGWRTYRTETPTGMATKIEARQPRAIPSANILGMEIGGKQVRIPGRLLMAEDEVFKAIGYRQEINALAIRRAVDEGKTGRAFFDRVNELRASPTEAMTKAARDAAEIQTFSNPLGPAGRSLQSLVANVPGMRFIVPFIRTPANLVKYAADRSPFAPLFAEARANLSGKNGAIARDNQIARIALGTTVSGVTAYLAAQGLITGNGPGPTESARRAVMRADGWQPYSLKIGDTYYSYSRLEPFGQLMGVAADFVEMQDNMDRNEKNNLAVLMAGSVARNLISKTWLRGPAETIEAFQDPQRYGPRYLQRLAGTVVPTVVAQSAQASDPFIREARTVLDTIRSRLPGEREKLFIRRDAFGEPITRDGALGPDIISPIYQSAAKHDPVAAEMLRLKVVPGRLPRNLRNVELSDAEYDHYSRVAGQTMHRALSSLVGLPQWQDLPEAVQADAMGDAIRKSRDLARAETLTQFPDLPLRVLKETLKRKRLPQEAR